MSFPMKQIEKPVKRSSRNHTPEEIRANGVQLRTSVYFHSPNTVELKAKCVENGVSFNGVVDELLHQISPTLIQYFNKPVAFRLRFNWPRH